jgi:LmbE family N-acetylglucosaminyl deacetylase
MRWVPALLALASLLPRLSHGADPFDFSKNDSILVVSPHPDDETLCCAGIMRRALEAGARVSVVWVTGGDAFELDARLVEKRLRPGRLGLRKLGERRMGEAMAAADKLGIPPQNRFVLGYPDRGIQRLMLDHFYVPLRSRYSGQSNVAFDTAVTPRAPYEGSALAADLRKVLDITQPTYVFVASPLDLHPDHSASGEFVMRILGERNQLDRLYYWIIHGGFDWPRPRGLHRQTSLIPPERARDLPWLRFELTDEEQDDKLAALQEHHSQMEIMRSFLRAFVRRNELFTRVPLLPETPVPILTPETAGEPTP